MKMRKQGNAKPLWHPSEKEDLQKILNRMDSSTTIESLNNEFVEAVKAYPKYQNLFKVAQQEKHQQIDNSILSFEGRERKTRKKWLWSFFLYYVIFFLLFAVGILISGSPQEEGFMPRLRPVIPIFAVFGVVMWFIYHCAYLKKGTLLISCIVFMVPTQMLLTFMREGIDLSQWYIEVFSLVLVGYYWFNSLGLRRINYEIKARNQLYSLKETM